MPKPRYRLQALLEVRRRLKKKAEDELGRAIRKLREEKERLKKLEKEKEEILNKRDLARKEMSAQMSIGAVAGYGIVHTNYIRKLEELQEEKEEQIEDQKMQVEEAENNLALARRGYIDACKALQIMEKHKDLWAKKIKQEISRKEEREMDELAQTIYQLKKWKGEKPMFEE